MEIIEFTYKDAPKNLEKMNLCLGFFDGLHLGHQKIIASAKKDGVKVGLLSFSEPPSYVLGYRKDNKCLMSIDDKANVGEQFGVDYLLILHFDEECACITREEFVNNILNNINPNKIFVGEDFKFGFEGKGNPKYLSKFFDVKITPILKKQNNKISSRKIRELVEEGNIKAANSLLGHHYAVAGNVVNGLHNGTSIGFPTANLKIDFPYVVPKNGVYLGNCIVREEKKKCLICVSNHPSIMKLNSPIIEVHILDFNEDLYGVFIAVSFIEKIRDIILFDNLDDLKSQIEKDKQKLINSKY